MHQAYKGIFVLLKFLYPSSAWTYVWHGYRLLKPFLGSQQILIYRFTGNASISLVCVLKTLEFFRFPRVLQTSRVRP